MHKLWVAYFVIAALAIGTFFSSSANARVVCGAYYPSYGVLTADESNPNVYYRLNVGGVLLAAIFAPTIIVPVYVLGFDLMTPVAPRAGVCPQLLRKRYSR